jgi:hypothetical protein
MPTRAVHSPIPKIYLALNAAALITAGVWMLSIAGGGPLSSLRSVLIGGTFLLAALAAAGAILLQLQPEKERALYRLILGSGLAPKLALTLGLFFAIFWCLTSYPPEYTGNFRDYFLGLYPLILWGTLASGSALTLILIASHGSSGTSWRKYWLEHRALLAVTIVSLAGFTLIVLLTWVLKILHSNEPFWRGAGVPILASQVFIAAVIGFLALQVRASSVRKQIPVDLLLFILIWAVSAILWAAQPVPESFWVTGPMPPNHEYYPFSDLMTFDLGSQFALIGQGIFNGVFWDRALYMSFLVYLHSVGGQNYQELMSIQAGIFAVFPALTYLIGSKLHSRIAGLILAALITMRGLNSLIAAPWIHSSTFKHMLTDFPTPIAVAIFVLLMLKWLESPRDHRHLVMWASGVLGLTSLLRPHVLLLLPAVFLLAICVHWAGWKQGLITLGLALLAFLASISPWTFLAPGAGSVFALYGQRIHDVMQQRYPQIVLASPQNSQLPEAPEIPPSGVLSSLPPPTSSLPFPATQFLHNLVTTGLIFPDSPEFISVLSTVKSGEDFWKFDWAGRMSLTAAIMLILNLAIVALGLGAAYQLLRWRGLLPLAVLFIYHAANALARTSGGRYLVPIDWILVAYYALGLAEIMKIGTLLLTSSHELTVGSSFNASTAIAAAGEADQRKSVQRPTTREPNHPDHAGTGSARQNSAPWYSRPASSVVLLAMIGGLVPLAGILYPRRYPERQPQSLVDEITPYLPALGLRSTEVETFLKQPGAVVLYGRALYPRFYRQGKGELFSYGPFLAVNYPRTVFVLIGPHGLAYVVLPGRVPKVLPNASDAALLGCESHAEGYSLVSAVALILPEQGATYARSPAAPLTCPLPEPVCDNNGNCR